MKTEQSNPSIDPLAAIAASIRLRLHRMRSCDAALFRLLACYSDFRVLEEQLVSSQCPAARSLASELGKMEPERAKILDKEYSRATVSAAISMLDSFIGDVLKLLFLKFPSAIPKERSMKVHEVFAHSNFDGLLSAIIDKYIRELGYQSLGDRIAFIEQRFGLVFSDPALKESLCMHSELRNRLVHDFSLCSLHPSGDRIIARIRNDAPEVSWEQADKFTDDCIRAIDDLFGGVSEKVCGARLKIMPEVVDKEKEA